MTLLIGLVGSVGMILAASWGYERWQRMLVNRAVKRVDAEAASKSEIT